MTSGDSDLRSDGYHQAAPRPSLAGDTAGRPAVMKVIAKVRRQFRSPSALSVVSVAVLPLKCRVTHGAQVARFQVDAMAEGRELVDQVGGSDGLAESIGECSVRGHGRGVAFEDVPCGMRTSVRPRRGLCPCHVDDQVPVLGPGRCPWSAGPAAATPSAPLSHGSPCRSEWPCVWPRGIVAGHTPGPGSQMGRGREAAHGLPDLGDDHRASMRLTPGSWSHSPGGDRAQSCSICAVNAGSVSPASMACRIVATMNAWCSVSSRQRAGKQTPACSHRPQCQIGEHAGSRSQRLARQHGPGRLADVGDHRGQLDAGIFEEVISRLTSRARSWRSRCDSGQSRS